MCLLGLILPAKAAARPADRFQRINQVKSEFAIADFDGDSLPDLATVQASSGNVVDTRYWIAFQMSGGARQVLGITGPTGGVQISSKDVNGDDFADVVVTTAWTNLPVAVLLNDGKGNFTAYSPSNFSNQLLTIEKSWNTPAWEIKDAFALPVSRESAVDCGGAAPGFLPVNQDRLVAGRASDGVPVIPLMLLAARAPPILVASL